MERLLKPEDIATRYGVNQKTARKYMREMTHRENPLRVTERAVKAWDEANTFPPVSEIKKALKRKGA